MQTTIAKLTMQGHAVDAVELMRDCTPLLGDMPAMREQMQRCGYVYLPGLLGRDRVEAGRRVFIESLQRHGCLAAGSEPMDGIYQPNGTPKNEQGRLETLFDHWQPIHDVLYSGPMIEFFEAFFGENVRHFDFTWTRQVKPGPATPIHSDVVYMGRGTHELFTAWTPFGDNDFSTGGLIVLEGSNNHAGLAKSYFHQDVDSTCINKPNAKAWAKSWATGGHLAGTANQLHKSLATGPWRTADFAMGDVVLFNCYTVHGGTDNHSDRWRLSTDTRYQRASAPADDRWIGASPAGHGPAGKRDKVC